MSAHTDSDGGSTTAGWTAGPAGDHSKYDNPDEARETLEEFEQNKQERAAEWREQTSKQRAIEQSLRSDTVELPVGGEPVDFSAIRSRKASQWAATVREQLRNLDPDEIHSEFPAEVDRVYHELGDRAEPDWMNQTWWERNVSIKMALDYVELLNMDTDLSVEQFRQFRGQ